MGKVASDSISLNSVKDIKDTATAANTTVTALNVHFYHDDGGAHIVSDASGAKTDLTGDGIKFSNSLGEIFEISGNQTQGSTETTRQYGIYSPSEGGSFTVNEITAIGDSSPNLTEVKVISSDSSKSLNARVDIEAYDKTLGKISSVVGSHLSSDIVASVRKDNDTLMQISKDGNMAVFGNIIPSKGVDFTQGTGADGLLAVVESTACSNKAVSASNIASGTATVTKAGYYPIGIVGQVVSGTGMSFASIYNLYLSNRKSGSATINYGVRNYGTSTASLTIKAYVLWMKYSG